MLTFRKKIFLCYFSILVLFSIILYPATRWIVDTIHRKHLQKQVQSLIEDIQYAPSIEELIDKLDDKRSFLFFKYALFDEQAHLLFHSQSDLMPKDFEELSMDESEQIKKILLKGSSYSIYYSPLFEESMINIGKRFYFQDRIFALQGSFPNGQVEELTRAISIAFIVFILFLLLAFTFLIWLVFHHQTKPVFDIINAIKPYQEGKTEFLSPIQLSTQEGEFNQLSSTLNSLSEKIRMQVGRLTHEKNQKNAILESLIEGVIAVNNRLEVVYLNQAARGFLGLEKGEHQPFSILDLHQPVCEQLIKKAMHVQEPVSSILKTGRKKYKVLDLVAVRLPDHEGAILVMQDKTALHRVIEMGRDFVANASHELKTPITIIRGFTETLHDHPDIGQPMLLNITHTILNNCTRMETLVKNLLTLAALDEGLPDSRLKLTDIQDLIDQAIQTIKVIHPQAIFHIILDEKESFLFKVDPDLFLQALLNLIDNACKYSKPPAQVTIRLNVKNEKLELKVSDKGIGIPKEDIDRIFERFFAVDKSHSRALGGSGLGLSIVEQIVEKHQGKIEVESQEGMGTTFTLHIPKL